MPLLRALAVATTLLVVATGGLVALGLAFGKPWLFLPRVPPRNGMDRFLLIVWPMACLCEALLGGLRWRHPPAVQTVVNTAARLVVVAGLGWVLLWGSVHLREEPLNPLLAVWAVGAAVVWQVMPRQMAPAVVAGALGGALIATGVMIVIGGWLKGGLTALPLALAVAVLTWKVRDERLRGVVIGSAAAAVVGLVALGHYFGRVSTLQAAVIAACLVAVAVVGSWPRVTEG